MDLEKLAEKHGVMIEYLPVLPPVPIGDGPWKIYVYDHMGYHSGGKWFRKGPMKYPGEEIKAQEAKQRADKAIAAKREVRICDGGDRLVFHSKHGKMIAPSTADGFWTAAGLETA